MPDKPPRKATQEKLARLARANTRLSRLGIKPLLTVEEARQMPWYDVDEWIVTTEAKLSTASKAMRGYLG